MSFLRESDAHDVTGRGHRQRKPKRFLDESDASELSSEEEEEAVASSSTSSRQVPAKKVNLNFLL